jgi:hypothetical protein
MSLLQNLWCAARRSCRIGLLSIALPLAAPAQIAPEIDFETAYLDKSVTAVRISDPITLDGFMDEAVWELARPATDFVQRFPNTGQIARERTEVRFLYDDENIYIGFICFDSDIDRAVVTQLTEDFNFRGSDSVSLIFDGLHDRRSGFSFVVNIAGAKADQQVINSGFNTDWDGVWDARTSRNEEMWIAEIMVPFKTLRFTNDASQVWGVNMSRRVLRLNEESYWAPIPIRYNLARLSLAGTLEGLEGISQGRNLKVTPFVTAGVVQSRPPTDPVPDFATDKDIDGGVDLKYSVTPSLTLDATYRTDFAQVEVDRQQVNLTRFNLFFPEKRDFFLENAATFSFGGSNNVVPFFSRRIGLSRSGTPIPIVGGARVTGRVGQYDVGFLSMKTESLGTTPSNNYTVARLKRNLLTNSWIGGLVTSRDSSVEADYNRVYGADAHFEFNNRLYFDSYLLASDTPGESGRDHARQFETAWRDDELILSAGYNEVQTNFNPEVGFVRRRNNTRYNGSASWLPRLESSATVRNLIFATEYEYFRGGTTGKIESRFQRLETGIQFENTSSINVGLNHTFDRLTEDFRIRPAIVIPVADYSYQDYWASFRTDSSDKISGDAAFEWGKFWDGRRRSFRAGISFKPNFRFNADFDYSHNRIRLPSGEFTTDLVGLQILYGFSPNAFLNGLFQYNADTRRVSSNIRFNLIHHPLSDLFLVYNDVRDSHTGHVLERSIIFKLTNLFNF